MPNQTTSSRELLKRNPLYFLLKLNEETIIGIELHDSILFLFADPAITYRQFCVDSYIDEKKDTKNFSTLHAMETKNCIGISRNLFLELLNRIDKLGKYYYY